MKKFGEEPLRVDRSLEIDVRVAKVKVRTGTCEVPVEGGGANSSGAPKEDIYALLPIAEVRASVEAEAWYQAGSPSFLRTRRADLAAELNSVSELPPAERPDGQDQQGPLAHRGGRGRSHRARLPAGSAATRSSRLPKLAETACRPRHEADGRAEDKTDC